MTGHGSRPSMVLLTAGSCGASGRSLDTNLSLWWAQRSNAGTGSCALCVCACSCVYLILTLHCVCVCVCVCRSALFYSNEVQQYAVPFMGADPSVVKRSQRFLLEEHQETPVGLSLTQTHGHTDTERETSVCSCAILHSAILVGCGSV
jgi:hypothetical protein